MRHIQPERQQVYRQFGMRWTPGCLYTRVYAADDDALTRGQIERWSAALDEIVPQLGEDFISVIDTRDIGEIPRSLWMGLVQLSASMPRLPRRRALLAAQGWAGDSQAQAVQLVTAGNVRVFRSSQFDEMITWLAQAQTIEASELRSFVS